MAYVQIPIVPGTVATASQNPAPTTSFSDNFNRTNTVSWWGEDWYPVMTDGTSSFLQDIVDNLVIISTNRGRFRSLGTGAGGSSVNIWMVPRPLSQPQIYGQSQFAQATYINGNSTGAEPTRSGPAVMIQPNAGATISGYSLITVFETGNFILRRGVNGSTLASGFTLAVNDILRIECTASAANNQIRVYRNGVLQATVNDSTGPLLKGVPGFAFAIATNASATVRFDDWDDFSCGIL